MHYESSRGAVPESSEANFALIQNELSDLSSLGVVASFGKLEDFSPSGFSETLYLAARDSLDMARNRFIDLRNRKEKQREALSVSLVDRWGGDESFIEMRSRYTNKRLEDLLLNRGQFVVNWNSHLIRKASPIYQVPKSKTARAHLYAPVKRVGPIYVNTYWFNLLIIWFSGLQLYFALVYDLLRRFTNWNQIRKLRKGS